MVEAIKKAADTLLHCSNLYHIEPQARLAKALRTERLGRFFCNSGAEANEAGHRLHGVLPNCTWIPNDEIITALGSFHGRTLAT